MALFDHSPSRSSSPTAARRLAAPSRRRFKDTPALLGIGILLLIAVLAGTMTLVNRGSRLSPDFLTEFVLIALSAVDLTMLVALGFVLARSVVKLVVERRRALPFARFRAKLVVMLLAMTLVPAVLVLVVGSELLRNSVNRWFNAPMEEVLQSAQRIASDYYHERQLRVTDESVRIARSLGGLDLTDADVRQIRDLVTPAVNERRVSLVEVYRLVRPAATGPLVVPVVQLVSPMVPAEASRESTGRLALRAALGQSDSWVREPLPGGGELLSATAVVRRADGTATGVVVAGEQLTGDIATRARRMTRAYQQYTQLQVLKQPLTGVYLSFFLMVTLMILVSATWMGLYLAKRITRPVQALAAAAREIGAGHFEHRVVSETADEFGALVDAFNSMADELSTSRRRLERSAVDLEKKHAEVEERRRYTATILERVATGVVTLDGTGRISTLNPAAGRLLGLPHDTVGQTAAVVFARPDLEPLSGLVMGTDTRAGDTAAQEIALVRDGRECHLAVAATALTADSGRAEGRVLVLDDITPLIRAQKVAAWREVARRLAHEIKNPLTPIQLCAQRLQRQFAGSPEPVRQLVDECTLTIVGEVESLKALVDEFSQFARMPSPRRVPTNLHELLQGTLTLYDGLFKDVRIQTLFAVSMPPVRIDPDQFRRVVINLIDNAVEALNQHGQVVLETVHDAGSPTVRLIIADNGPGIPVHERDKLFMPYYSTKKRGSGLGLAIVRRIVAEHGGTIEVGDNSPQGTRFTIELPVEGAPVSQAGDL
jgi:two-component system, NtrC family, nitrogen regulation sensor histidine kinase NtrY